MRDAFEHFRESPAFEPFVYFGKETIWYDNPGNLWLSLKDQGLAHWEIRKDDVLFFAGWDWKVLSPEEQKQPPVPILNIAQPRHTRLEDARRNFLKNPAIRIAKSSIGKKILEDYGVNGPVYLIPDAIDLSLIPPPNPDPGIDVLIVGLKNPDLARALQARLKRFAFRNFKRLKVEIQIPPKLPTREDFLNLLNRSKIAVFLPLDESRGAEGFYLPALEGMAMKKLVICPYAVGNIDFCLPGETCLQPEYNLDALYEMVRRALKMKGADQKRIIENGYKIVQHHTIEKERFALLELLHSADDIWNQKDLFER